MKFLTHIVTALAAATLTSTSVVKSPTIASQDGNFELLILHNNDMHARFEQTSQLSGTCTTADREAGKCYGGFPRVAYVVKEARRAAAAGEGPPVLYLNAGDTYTGTAWFTIYKWKIAAEFINALQPDAVALGNNEMERGSDHLSPFIDGLQAPVIATNIIVKGQPNKLHKSLIFDINKIRIGVVGYLTPDSQILDDSRDIEYIEEVIALQEEVSKLKTHNISIVIALGHADFSKNIEVAKVVEGIDLIIAGHKNYFMWNGASAEVQDVDEVIEIHQSSGKIVPVIRSYAYNKYLGKLRVQFDAKGDLTSYAAEPVLLDNSVSEDTKSRLLLNILSKDMARNDEVVGQTAVVLDGDSCRTEECNLGNLITDAIVYHYAVRYNGERWTDAPVAVIPGAYIAASIAPINRPADITLANLLTALPYESDLVAVTMNGIVLLEVLEHAISNYDKINPTGQLLQFSGIRIVYDLNSENGARIKSAVVRCWACAVPEFYTIDDWRDYKILMPVAMANGDLGFSMLVGLPRESLTYDEITCVSEYIRLRSPVYPEVAERIDILNIEDEVTPPTTDTTTTESTDTTLVGQTAVVLDGDSCRTEECNLGNLITDAIVYHYAVRYNGERWTDAPVAVIPGAYIAASIAPINRPADITLANLLTALPYESDLVAVTMNGIVLLEVLEHAISNYDKINPTGQLLQFSGIRIVYDLNSENGARIKSAVVRCWACAVPEFYTIDDWRDYKILMPVAMANGDLGFSMLVGLPRESLTYDEITCVSEYIRLRSPVYPEVAERIDILNIEDEVTPPTTDTTTTESTDTTLVGQTAVVLDGDSCRTEECNLGNLITDAIVYHYAVRYNGERWTDAPVAVIPGAYIAASIAPINRPADITLANLLTALPYESDLVAVTMNGIVLLEVLEHAISNYDKINPTGQLLQFSGIRIVYDLNSENGARIKSAVVRCWACAVPEFYTIDDWRDYKILMPVAMANGDLGFSMLVGLPRESLTYDEITCVSEYIRLRSPVYPEVAERIDILNIEDEVTPPTTDTTTTESTDTTLVGQTAVVLDGDSCRTEECNLGNLITDAIVYHYAVRYNGERWTDAPVAVIPGAYIAASIAPTNRPADITLANLLTALPYESDLVAVTMNGIVLLEVLEHSISNYDKINPTGQLLQFSGIRIVYDLNSENGRRIKSAVVRCWACAVPEFYTIDDWRDYKILMPVAMANGDLGFSMLVGLPRESVTYDAITCVSEYIRLRSPVYPEVAERIDILNIEDEVTPPTTDTTTTESTDTTTTEVTNTTTTESTETTTTESTEATTPDPDSAVAISSSITIFIITIISFIIM